MIQSLCLHIYFNNVQISLNPSPGMDLSVFARKKPLVGFSCILGGLSLYTQLGFAETYPYRCRCPAKAR